ncbi:hypothetical protein EDD11_004510 [Mortierella claussenii]|nr:hypothetical protein EDD11_004510 [Mortierella claussenii]
MRQNRLRHTSSGTNAQTAESVRMPQSQSADSNEPVRWPRIRQPRFAAAFPVQPNALESMASPPPSPPRNASIKEKTLKKNLRNQPATYRRKRLSPSIPTPIDTSAVALGNFRLLVHSDRLSSQHAQNDSLAYRRQLSAEYRIPSSIIPPLPALQHLYSFLVSSQQVHCLTAADWNAFIFWLSHLKDHQTLSSLHPTAISDLELGNKCSAASYALLTEARLQTLKNRHSLTRNSSLETASPSQPSSSVSIVQDTIEWMKGVNIPRNLDLYRLWLKVAVQESCWNAGITAWKQLNAENTQLPQPSMAMASCAIQCYLNAGDIAGATRLFGWVQEHSAASIQRRGNASVLNNGVQPRAASSKGVEGGELSVSGDEHSEFLKRQEQTSKHLAALQQRSSTVSTPVDVQEWKAIINPALIEAICLDNKDKEGSLLASELAINLFKEGNKLDESRFRRLVQHIGLCSTSEGAEAFVRELVKLIQSTTSEPPLPLLTDKHDKRVRGTMDPSLGTLIEVGLHEVAKRASMDQDFNRAKRIFEGMTELGVLLGSDAAESLIVGLTKNEDYQSAINVLNASLQNNHVPSLDTANTLLRGLIKGDMLDASVAVFRNLTENYGFKPNVEMYRNVMDLTATYGQPTMTQRIMSTLTGLGVKLDSRMYRDVMLCYVRSENLQLAIKAFEDMDRARIPAEIIHINVLLEGAVRHSTPATIVGILEVMSSDRIHPDPETWNILLGGALRADDHILSLELYHELCYSVVEGHMDKADGSLRASRHPKTFQLLMIEYADRHGVESALNLLKRALDAEYPIRVTSSMYRNLLSMSCKQHKGAVGYEFFQLLKRSEQIGMYPTGGAGVLKEGKDAAFGFISTKSKKPVTLTSTIAIAPASPSSTPTLANLCQQLMEQLEREDRIDLGREVAADLIVSGMELTRDLAASAIRLFARSGDLASAFGLFMKMKQAYRVEPSPDMVQTLYDTSRAHGLIVRGTEPGLDVNMGGRNTTKWDPNVTQHWIKALTAAIAKYGLKESA